MSKRENILNQYNQAKAKKEQIEKNISLLEGKILVLQQQIEKQKEKVGKIDFFLSKTEKTLQDQGSANPNSVCSEQKQLLAFD